MHGWRRYPGDMLPEKPIDFPRILVRDETKTKFCSSASRNDALSSWPLIATADAVDGERRTERQSFVKRVTALAPSQFGLRIGKNLIVRRPGARHMGALLLAPAADAVINTGNRNAAICVVKLGDHLA